jgi:tetratricopeptide (TPR) repeat protein
MNKFSVVMGVALLLSMGCCTGSASPGKSRSTGGKPQHSQAAPAKPRPAEAQRTKAQQTKAPTLARGPFDHLTPVASWAGIVVCAPLSRDASLVDFGAACGRWLHFVVAGHAELGKTPFWSAVDGARRELNKLNLRLNPVEAAQLSTILGVTHVATGLLEGRSTSCTLTYQLREMPSGKAVGEPLRRTGSQEQLVAQLPAMARQLAALLGVKSPRVPPSVAATPAELKILGQVSWTGTPAARADLSRQLQALAQRLPLAGLLALRQAAPHRPLEEWWYTWSESLVDDELIHTLVKNLVEQAPDNQLVLGEIAQVDARELTPYITQVEGVLARYPNSYLVAAINSEWLAAHRRYSEQRKAAEHAVRCSPRSPQAWLLLGEAIADQASNVRRGRTSDAMTGGEWAYLNRMYPLWLHATLRATRLDPGNSVAWLNASKAATFSGHDSADAAFWKALQLDKENSAIYDWGMQMYQPKWGGDPENLLKVVATAVANPRLLVRLHVSMDEALRAIGQIEKAEHLKAMTIAHLQKQILRNPSNAMAYYYLALLRWSYPEDKAKPVAELTKVAALRPNSAEAHYRLSLVLADPPENNDEAMKHAREAIRLNPYHKESLRIFGALLVRMGRYGEAEKVLREVVHARPQDAVAHHVLARAIMTGRPEQSSDAIYHFREALRLTANWNPPPEWYQDAHHQLGYALWKAQKYEEAETVLREAIELDPDDAVAHQYLGVVLRDLERRDEAIEHLQTVLRISPDYGMKYTGRLQADVHYLLCDLLSDQAQHDAAIEAGKRAVEIAPGDYWANTFLGKAYLRKGQIDQSLELLKKAVAISPNSSGAYLFLGEALWATGEKAQANEMWRKAASVDSKEPSLAKYASEAQKLLQQHPFSRETSP